MPRSLKHQFLITGLLLMLPMTGLKAANYNWTGPGGDMTTAANWGGTVPVAGDSGTFTNSNPLFTSVAFSGTSNVFAADQLIFAGPSGYIVLCNGQALGLASINLLGTGITNSSGTNQFVDAFNGGQVNFFNSSSADSTLSGQVIYRVDKTAGVLPSQLNFNNSSSAGAATIISGASSGSGATEVIFSNSSSAGTSSINISNGNEVRFQNSSTAQSSSMNLNASNLNILNSADLASSNTFAAQTSNIVFDSTVSATTATISLNNSSTLTVNKNLELSNLTSGSSTSVITINNNSEFTIDNPFGQFLPCLIQGAGGIFTKNGSDSLSLGNNSNSYTGGTNINDGTLLVSTQSLPVSLVQPSAVVAATGNLTFQFANAAPFSGNISDNGIVEIGYGNIVEISGNISGTGQLIVDDTAELTLTGTNSYSGLTSLTGTLHTQAANLPAAAVVTTTAATSLLDFTTTGTETFNGQVSGIGQLQLSGTGHLTLTGANSYTGGTTVNAGILTGDTTSLPVASSNPSIVVNNNGSILQFDQNAPGTFTGGILLNNASEMQSIGSSSLTISGPISGTGELNVTNGQLTLLGTNTYSGGTNVAAGTVLSGDSNSLQGTIALTGATLNFEQAINGSFTGTITGDNASIMNKNGAGVLTLSTPNPLFVGTTNVNAGTFNLNALLGGDVNVFNAIISGIGTVGGNLNMQSGSTISPGNSIGTFFVAGNYTQAAGSTYFLEINGAGQSDLISVGGTATINGGQVLIASLDTPLIDTPYTILTATGGVAGQFDSAVMLNPLFVPTLSYDPNNVYLNIAKLTFSAVTPNEIAVATQLESITNPTADELIVLTALAALPAEEQQRVLNEMSGEQYTNAIVSAEMAGHQFIRRLYDPIRSIVTTTRCCDDLCCDSCPSFDAWIEGGGGRTFIKGDENARGFHLDGYEVTGGIQSTLNRDWTLGVAGSYAEDKVDYKIGGSGKHQIAFAGLYGLYRPACWYVLADAAFGYHEHKTHRRIRIGALEYIANSTPKIYEGSGYIEAGIDYSWSCLLIQPFLGFEFDYFQRNGFTETGASPLNLIVSKKNHTNVHSRLGLHLTANEMPYNIMLSLDLAWQYRLTSLKNSITERFESFGETFTIRGSKFNKSSVDGAITLSTTICDSLQLYVEASGERWSRASNYSFLGGVKYSW